MQHVCHHTRVSDHDAARTVAQRTIQFHSMQSLNYRVEPSKVIRRFGSLSRQVGCHIIDRPICHGLVLKLRTTNNSVSQVTDNLRSGTNLADRWVCGSRVANSHVTHRQIRVLTGRFTQRRSASEERRESEDVNDLGRRRAGRQHTFSHERDLYRVTKGREVSNRGWIIIRFVNAYQRHDRDTAKDDAWQTSAMRAEQRERRNGA